MRVLLDTNVLISNLLSPNATTSATGIILQAALAGRFVLLFVAGVAEELDRKLATRADLAKRIAPADAAILVRDLHEVGEVVPRLTGPYPEVGRDRNDDYLIAHALLAEANYLVSWDKDLRDLGEVGGIKLVSPPEFLQVLRDGGLA